MDSEYRGHSKNWLAGSTLAFLGLASYVISRVALIFNISYVIKLWLTKRMLWVTGALSISFRNQSKNWIAKEAIKEKLIDLKVLTLSKITNLSFNSAWWNKRSVNKRDLFKQLIN